LFKCAIGFVDIYDQPVLYEKGDVSDRDSGAAFVNQSWALTRPSSKKYSPAHRADALNLPIFFTHGERDSGAPVEHTLLMMETMDAAEKPYQKLLFEKEGHGLYDPATRAAIYKAIVAFLKNLLNVVRPMRYRLS
jgi:dipeptidyl aminopeptidase/acylaminoacyl peptidase